MQSDHQRSSAERYGIDIENVPVHVACVMDGNGRWAAQRDLPRTDGHIAGERALTDVVEGAIELGVRWLTAYAFSTENWSRPSDEVDFLMRFHTEVLTRQVDELHEQGVRLVFAGRRGWPVPDDLATQMDEAMAHTSGNDRLTLTVAFNYGGRAEIVDAVRALVAGGASADEIDEAAIRAHLYVPEMPDVDLLVRTSQEFRISNFLLWQVAYAELVFTDTLWPDFDRNHLAAAVQEYQRRHRRFGGLAPPASSATS